MNAQVEHLGIWVSDLEAIAQFYARYFEASIGDVYENPRKGFRSRFLRFAGGARLELMTRADVTARASQEQLGLAHVAIRVGDEIAVDACVARLRSDGHRVVDGPRRTGDGYYECVVLDPEGNRLEIMAG